jgi:hypothetical protein
MVVGDFRLAGVERAAAGRRICGTMSLSRQVLAPALSKVPLSTNDWFEVVKSIEDRHFGWSSVGKA